MGCASSKRVDAPYRPSPMSLAVFDINSIEEPWLKHLNNTSQKPAIPLLHKLDFLDSNNAPQSWDQVSKTLEQLKSSSSPPPPPPPAAPNTAKSFHTLEELDAKLKPKSEPRPKPNPRPIPEIKTNSNKDTADGEVRIKPLKENMFIVRDRVEREKEEKEGNYERLRRDPLREFPERCPPGGGEAVVIYTTSLGGVRKTFEECNGVREVLERHRVVYDERDVSLHGDFLRELKELLGPEEDLLLPSLFVKGRHVGGLQELLRLNETGRLARILSSGGVQRGVGRLGCGGCGGARFVPCFQCGGSCKVAVPDAAHKERCPQCNENGLIRCPACA